MSRARIGSVRPGSTLDTLTNTQAFSTLALQTRRAVGAVVGRPLELAAIQEELASAAQGRLAGITVEGDFGRFKPDVVAPGTFVLSTRSSQWDEQAYYNPTNYNSQNFQNFVVQSNSTYNSARQRGSRRPGGRRRPTRSSGA